MNTLSIIITTVVITIIVIMLFCYVMISYYEPQTTKLNCKGPSKILIIRHGEKPEDKEDFFLSDQGKERAVGLIEWVKDNKIDEIYTPEPILSGRDSRPRQTVSLAAFYNNIPIMGTYSYFENKGAAQQILCNPNF